MTLKNSTRRIWKLFGAVYDHTEGILMVVFCLMLVADVLAGILARYVRFEVVFANELGKYIFIWLCAIGISAAAKDNQHVRILFFVERIPVNRKYTWILSQVFFLIFSLFLFYWGLRLTWMQLVMNKSAMGFHFPMFVFTAALPVGFALTSMRLIIDIVMSFKESNRELHADQRPPWTDSGSNIKENPEATIEPEKS